MALPPRDIKTLNRLIAGHDYSNFWLNKMKLTDNGTCNTCHEPDIGTHRVFKCHKYSAERNINKKINEPNFIAAWKKRHKNLKVSYRLY